MLKIIAAIGLTSLATSCVTDESISGYADPTRVYVLQELDGELFDGRATISFPEEGQINGHAPCNSYFAQQTEFYPWFGVEAIGATRMACPELEAEAAFFAAIGAMTLAEVIGPTLILSNTDGRKMVFVAP